MRRFAIRCDYCGVFHKIQIDESGVVEIENFSGIVYEIANEDVQLLNTLPPDENEKINPERADKPIG